MTRLYLAGPCTGYIDFNYPAFHAEAARLRALGYHVENPAENTACETWQAYMRNAIRQMLTCDMVAMLTGFENSKGASIEFHLALDLGIPVRMAYQLTEQQAL